MIDDVVDLVQLLTLELVSEDSFTARRGAPGDEAEIGQAVKFSVGASDTHELLTEFGFRYVDENCTVETEYTAVWSCPKAITVSGQCMVDFLERVAYMSVYPYFREAVGTFSTRLRVPVPTLGLVRQGTVDLQIDAHELGEYLANKVFGGAEHS